MEVVGTAAAIIQLAGVGLALAKTLYSVSDEISSGNKQIRDLAFYVQSTSVVLEEVGEVFKEEGAAPKPLISNNAITTANEVVARCKVIFDKLHRLTEDSRNNAFGSLKLILRSARRQRLQTGLEQSKSDLQLMMQVIIYARLKLEAHDATKEANFREALKEMINENKAIHERHFQSQYQERQEKKEEKLNSGERINTHHDTVQPTQSTSTSITVHGNLPAPAAIRRRHPLLSTLPSSTEETANGVSSQARQGKCEDSFTKLADQDDCHYDDISYWFAVYLVCCPCLARNSRHHRRPGRPQPQRVPVKSSSTMSSGSSTSQTPASQESDLAKIGLWRPEKKESESKPESEVDKLLRQWTTVYDAPK